MPREVSSGQDGKATDVELHIPILEDAEAEQRIAQLAEVRPLKLGLSAPQIAATFTPPGDAPVALSEHVSDHWPEKYWDAVDLLYWSPKHLGLHSINRKLWGTDPDHICIPRSLVATGGTIYTRKGSSADNAMRMRGLEETLNHIFDITFSIAPDSVVRRLFLDPFAIDDVGPIQRLGREVKSRFGWGNANVTQQDMLLATPSSVVGVELKLGSRTSDIQVLKYLTLMVLEQRLTGPRDSLALLYITPNEEAGSVWADCRAENGRLPENWLRGFDLAGLNAAIERLFEADYPAFETAASQLRLAHISWKQLTDRCGDITADLAVGHQGDETLRRLLEGFAYAVRSHRGTGCGASAPYAR